METGYSAWITSLIVMYISVNQIIGSSLPSNLTELDMNAQGMTCIDFATLNQLKQLEKISFENGNMSFFPDKDCNNPAHEEDSRRLDLPNLKELILKEIKLVKVPNVSLMPQLRVFALDGDEIAIEIPQKHFINNTMLETLELTGNNFTEPPDLAGACNELSYLNLKQNKYMALPGNWLEGCKRLESLRVFKNELTSFPNLAPISNTISEIILSINQITGSITNDMIKDLKDIKRLLMKKNKLQGFDASFCQGGHPIEINVDDNPDLSIFENPYRFCFQKLDSFSSKPKLALTSTNIPCDHHRCWMKKFASKFTIQIDDCPDGRQWSQVNETDLCGQDKMGHGVVNRQDNQASFVYAPSPARNTSTMETRKELSEHRCAFWCFKIAACSYFEYAAETEDCTLKRLE